MRTAPTWQELDDFYYRVVEVLKRIDFGGFLVPISIEPRRTMDWVTLTFTMLVPDRDDPTRLIPISVEKSFSFDTVADPSSDLEIVLQVHSTLIWMMSHEVSEHLRFDGQRVFDPHKERESKVAVSLGPMMVVPPPWPR